MVRPDFEEIYETYFDTILNYAFRRTGDFETSKDIASEVFVKVYLNLWKFKWRKIPIQAWIYRIATNEINMYFRKKKYRGKMLEAYQIHSFLSVDENIIDAEKQRANEELERHTKFLRVQRAITSMDQKYQEVLSLRLFEGLSIKEIGEITGKKEGTIKSLLSRGVKKLKEIECNQ